MRIVTTLFLILLIAAAGIQLIRLYTKKLELNNRLRELERKTALLTAENKKIENDINYYQLPENLVKELKSKFDYKRAGEKMYIIIPKQQQ